jgi:hypothetical protein
MQTTYTLPAMMENPKFRWVSDGDHFRGPETRIRPRQSVLSELEPLVPRPHSPSLEILYQWEIG